MPFWTETYFIPLVWSNCQPPPVKEKCHLFLGAKFLSGEVVQIKKGNENPEVMETTQDNRIRQKFLFALRLYLNGVYRDTPPEALPAPPEIQEECVILWIIYCNLHSFRFIFIVLFIFVFSIHKTNKAVYHRLWLFVFGFCRFWNGLKAGKEKSK